MTTKQELSQLRRIIGRAITQLEWIQELTGLKLGEIEIALVELQDGVSFLEERLTNAK